MRFIPTAIHAASDYVLGVALLALPWIWMEESPVGAWIPIALGAVILVQAVMTDWELSLAKVVPVPMHLTMDAVLGIALAASPFVLDYWEEIWIPHVLIGAMMVGAAAFTRTRREAIPADMHGTLAHQGRHSSAA
jgi:hypothetical protein